MTDSIRGTILQTPSPGELQVLEDHLVTVDNGMITAVEPAGDRQADHTLDPDVVLLPGLIDTHIHAPQWPQLGTGLDLPLETWLYEYTFPLEARFVDEAFADAVWQDMVPALLERGTTTAVYYGSVHVPATTALARACLQHGQRAFVGRVAMDHPDGTPPWYRDVDAERAVDASARSIEEIHGLADNTGLVRPIITPRFIPACSDHALKGLSRLADDTGVLIQSHCSESDWEHRHVLERYGTTDAEALEALGLARDHTVLAHATHLSESDRGLLATSGAGISHCPLSNAYFSNAVFSARRALDAGVRVGLGTDIAGGSEPSVLAQCGHAVTASRMLEDGVDVDRQGPIRGRSNSRIDIITAFWMATVGGADLLGIPAGLLAPGRYFDAVAVDRRQLAPAPLADDRPWDHRFEQLVRNAGPKAIKHVWVDGHRCLDGGTTTPDLQRSS